MLAEVLELYMGEIAELDYSSVNRVAAALLHFSDGEVLKQRNSLLF